MQKNSTVPYLARYLHSKGERLGLPIGGNFELTARCNFNCPMCYVHQKEDDLQAIGKELTAGQWLDIAKQARDMGMVFALLTGGEPFVRKDFFEIYEGMKEMGLFISINSNGSMLQGKILERILENPPGRMNISLYGGSNETYRNMCGLPAYDMVFNNIRALKENGVDVRLNVSITPYNRQDLEAIHEAARQLNVHAKVASYMYPSIRVNGEQYGCGNRLCAKEAAQSMVQNDLLRFTPEEFARRAVNMKKLVAVDTRECMLVEDGSQDLEKSGTERESIRCRAGKSAFWLTWDGRMLPCGMMPGPTAYPLQDGFAKAWETLRAETSKIYLPAECTSCSKREVCSVCAAVCVTETGRFDGVPSYVCEMTQEIVNQTYEAYKHRT